jgi:hypothetical protein
MDRFTASIVKHGVIIHANPSLLPLRKNTFLVFERDLLTLRIDDFENYQINKNFKSIESDDKIHIFENIKDFSFGDHVDIYYEEYEFFGYKNILEKSGTIYKNQIFYPENGSESQSKKTKLYVSSIDEDELELEVEEKGSYINPPDQDTYFISDNGARIHLDHFYRKSTIKNYQNNMIKNITHGNGFLVLHLLNPLPTNVKEGIISLSKILIKTYSDISNAEKENEYFYIVNNKLPYLSLPFPEIEDEVAHKMLQDIFFKIDNKLATLEQEIKKLSNK